MNDQILITNIQRFSLHDGPGIRTTVFLKGCSLSCPWCSNPENMNYGIEEYSVDGEEGYYGKWYSTQELVKECIKDVEFYSGRLNKGKWYSIDNENFQDLPGGITFSGGECILQINRLQDAIKQLRSKNIHIAIETSLYVPTSLVERAIDLTDLFYVDLKIMDSEKALEVLGGDLKLFLQNIKLVLNSGKPIVIRVPVIGKYTDSIENMDAILEFIRDNKSKIIKVELLKEHDLARKKYLSLNKKITYSGVSIDYMEQYKKKIEACEVFADILTI